MSVDMESPGAGTRKGIAVSSRPGEGGWRERADSQPHRLRSSRTEPQQDQDRSNGEFIVRTDCRLSKRLQSRWRARPAFASPVEPGGHCRHVDLREQTGNAVRQDLPKITQARDLSLAPWPEHASGTSRPLHRGRDCARSGPSRLCLRRESNRGRSCRRVGRSARGRSRGPGRCPRCASARRERAGRTARRPARATRGNSRAVVDDGRHTSPRDRHGPRRGRGRPGACT